MAGNGHNSDSYLIPVPTEISSSLCDEEDGDFLNDLVLSMLKGDRLERATSIFAGQNEQCSLLPMTASPLNDVLYRRSPTALSPQLATSPART